VKGFLRRVITGEDRGFCAQGVWPLLWVLSCAYAAGVSVLRLLYKMGVLRSLRAGKPVISVGNITAGGVGKTPLVIFLAELLRGRGLRPVILTRGYMAGTGMRSDEADMMAECLPGVAVLVNPDRAAAVKEAEARLAPDVFILDDGFQHWRLKRDLDIVAIDASNPFGNGHVLPRGLLREPMSALARADLVILTKTDLGRAHVAAIRDVLKKLNPASAVVETVHVPVGVMDVFAGTRHRGLALIQDRVAAVCALGSPGSFKALLAREGARVEGLFTFDDHHGYTRGDIARIAGFCRSKKLNKVVTTHKDAVKIRHFEEAFQGISLLVLEIEIKVTYGEDELLSRLARFGHP